jgi:hypothetical protein
MNYLPIKQPSHLHAARSRECPGWELTLASLIWTPSWLRCPSSTVVDCLTKRWAARTVAFGVRTPWVTELSVEKYSSPVHLHTPGNSSAEQVTVSHTGTMQWNLPCANPSCCRCWTKWSYGSRGLRGPANLCTMCAGYPCTLPMAPRCCCIINLVRGSTP